MAYNTWLHQRDLTLRGVSPLLSQDQDERESLRTASFGSSSLFDELPTGLQLREKSLVGNGKMPCTVPQHAILHLGLCNLPPVLVGQLFLG